MSRPGQVAGTVIAACVIAVTGWTTAGAETGMVVSGAGATFPAPLYERWIEDYRQVRPDVTFHYERTGSGEGVERFLQGSVDFGASDAALSSTEQVRVDPRRGAVAIPMTAGMVVLAYRIPGIGQGLTLGRDVYPDIFAGRIRYWNDRRITATNPGLQLPASAILPVVRRESSGTTFAFTNHLAAATSWWGSQGPGVGKLVDWPGNAMTALGNEGVARRVQITDGSIGYIQYEFAKRLGLSVATLQNRRGVFVAPSDEAGRAALASTSEIPEDFRLFVADPDGLRSYPIVTYSWVLLRQRYDDPAKTEAIRGLMSWGLSEGQHLARDMGYVPLPEAVVSRSAEALSAVR